MVQETIKAPCCRLEVSYLYPDPLHKKTQRISANVLTEILSEACCVLKYSYLVKRKKNPKTVFLIIVWFHGTGSSLAKKMVLHSFPDQMTNTRVKHRIFFHSLHSYPNRILHLELGRQMSIILLALLCHHLNHCCLGPEAFMQVFQKNTRKAIRVAECGVP